MGKCLTFDEEMIQAFGLLKKAGITSGSKWTIWGALAFYWKTTKGVPIKVTRDIGRQVYKSCQNKKEWNKVIKFN